MTYRVSDAWWEVDLGEVYDIDHITLWNRTDCCTDRLREFYVFVSDVPFDVKDIKNTLTQDGVTSIYEPGTAGRRIDIPVERSGRYVRIQLSYDDAVLPSWCRRPVPRSISRSSRRPRSCCQVMR
jgi:hypothetical protein